MQSVAMPFLERPRKPAVALIAFRSGVPKVSIDPSDTGYEAVGLDRSENFAGVRVDLMDFPVTILPHPQGSLGPRKPRVTTAARGRNRGKHMPGFEIDLLDSVLGYLKEVLAIKGCSRMRGDIDRAHRLPACGIECIQSISGRKPDLLTVIGNSVHVIGT